MVSMPVGSRSAATSSPDVEIPRQMTCPHGDVWVVDTLSRRVVRRRCPACEEAAERQRANGL
jgi:hypothetical protein